jgi:hypothetical protein
MQEWAKTQFVKRNLEPENLIRALKGASETIMDQEPEDAFDALVERAGKPGTVPDPRVAVQVLEQVEQVVGRPEGAAPMAQRPALVDGLDEAARTLLQDCEQKVAEMLVQLVEQPKYRFAGAEEAVRQVNSVLVQFLSQQEPLCQDFNAKAQTAHSRIVATIDAIKAAMISKRRSTEDMAQLPSLLRLYPRFRFQALVVQRVMTVYRSLEGNCPEYQREFTYCRTRLTDLQKTFAKPPGPAAPSSGLGPGRNLFPAGCKSVDDAVNQLLQNISAAEVIALDTRIQEKVIRQTFQALVHVCTTPASNILRELESALQAELEVAVQERLGSSNVLDTFLGQAHREAGSVSEIATAFDEAVPQMTLGTRPDQQVAVVLVPAEPAAEQFQKLAQKAVQTAEVVLGPKGDDVVFYREIPFVSLSRLPQLGTEGRSAYEKMSAAEHCTPHSRTDILDWQKSSG